MILSPLQKSSLEQIYGRTSYKQKKLTATFLPKKKMYVNLAHNRTCSTIFDKDHILFLYASNFRVLHALLLQLFLKMGMKIEKVHRVVTFQQGDFMKTWVEFCTKKRSTAKNEFEKKFWKDVCIFFKTIF